MNYEDESYVRIYTRDDATWKRLRFAGQTLYMHLMRKVDRAGVLDGLDPVDPAGDIEVLVDVPRALVEEGLARMLAAKVAELHEGTLVIVDYVASQTAHKSSTTRSRDSRERRAAEARRRCIAAVPAAPSDAPLPSGAGRDETQRQSPERNDLQPLTVPVPVPVPVPNPTEREREPRAHDARDVRGLVTGLADARGMRTKFRRDWRPNDSHIARAQESGITPDRFKELTEHAKLKDHRPFTDEDDVFHRMLLFERQDAETRAFKQQARRAT